MSIPPVGDTQEIREPNSGETVGVEIFDSQDQEDAEKASRAQRLKNWVRRHPRRSIVVAVVVLALIATGFFVFRSSASSNQIMTRTVQVSKGEVSKTVNASGTVEPRKSEDLSFEVSGTVQRVYVKEGDKVSKGDALAAVGTNVLDAQLTAAESTVTAAEDQLSSAESSGSVTQIASASSQLASAEDSIVSAQAAVKNAVLRAPFSGQVISLGISKGDVVGQQYGGGTGSTGGSLIGGMGGTSSASDSSSGTIVVASTSNFVVDATVGSTDIEQLSKGMQAEISVSGSDETHYGTVSSISKVATTNSSGSAVFPVVIGFTGAVDDVYGGTSATVKITSEVRTGVVTVPTQAVTSEDGKNYVTVVESNGGTQQQEVTIGETYGTSTEILSGVDEGQSVQVTIQLPGGGGMRMRSGDGDSESADNLPNFPGGSGGFPGGSGGFPGGGSFPGGGQ